MIYNLNKLMKHKIMKKNDIEKFVKTLEIKYPPIGVSFAEKIPKSYKPCKDTVCTALARAFLKKQATYFNETSHRQSCRGADYYFKFANISDSEAIENYVYD